VTIANNPTLSGSEISFNNTVDGSSALTVKEGTGNVTFNKAIGETTPLTSLTANSKISLGGNVTTTGPQTYADAVTIANNPTLSGSEISFNNTVDGSSALTVKEGTGNVTFNKAIGETTPLTSLTANSKISLGGNVTTTGPQTYADAVTIANNPTLSGSDISFNNTVDGSSALTVKEGTGNVTFNKAIGETTPLTSLTANSKISLGGNVTTTGPQTYADAVTIANNPTLSGSEISFNNTVDGSSALTVKEGTGNVTFNKAIGETTPLTSLTANSKISLGGNVTTTGPQTYADAVTIANNPTLSGSEISFNNTVDGSSALTVKEGTGNVTFNKAIGETTPLTSLTANSKISLGGNVTTTGPQTYSDAVTIANNPIISGSEISFNNTVDGSSALTVKEGTGNVTFNKAIGETTPLTSLTANSKISLGGNVTTTGPQTYSDAVTIANNPTLSGSDISFNNTVDGSSALTVKEGTGNVTFNKAIGETTPLTSLTANSKISLGGNVTTTGPQTYADAVTIANNPTLSGSDISFNNTVDGSSALTVKEGTGNVAFNKAIGETTPLTSLTANSKISLGGNVTTTGPQTYADAVTIANNPTLSGSDITFNNTVDGSSDLTVNAVAVMLHSIKP
jgi:AICAR transformylase/IMP cyclohydrolase PurH